VDVTITADRGFGDQKRYEQIRTLGMHYVIRFRQDILLTTEFGDQKPAVEWLHPNGRARMLKQVAVTADCYIAAGDRARPRQEDEGTVVHRHLARRPHCGRCGPHLQPEIFDCAAWTPSEKQILALVARGMSNAAIAGARGTSVHTVANQIAALFRKTGATSRAELARSASAYETSKKPARAAFGRRALVRCSD
jgi:DNA-binding CsgD family transcriptional regulator